MKEVKYKKYFLFWNNNFNKGAGVKKNILTIIAALSVNGYSENEVVDLKNGLYKTRSVFCDRDVSFVENEFVITEITDTKLGVDCIGAAFLIFILFIK